MQKIAAAFVKAQVAFAPALKQSVNPHFKSKYVDLAGCVDAVIDALNANEIALVQKTHPDETGVTVETLFVHSSGETLSGGTLHVPAPKNDPQGYGSAMTYARRYSLMAACGIAPEDDDGQAASKPAKSNGHAEPPPAQPTRTWQTAIADLADGPAAEDLAKKLHEHYLERDQAIHDAAMRQLIARVALLEGEGKIPEAQSQSLRTVAREWILKKTVIEDTEAQAAKRF